MDSKKPECIVMGLSLTSLGVIRCLGRKGIGIIGLDHLRDQIGSKSKYCKSISCPEPKANGEELLNFMKGLGERLNHKSVIIPTSDSFVLFLARNKDALKPYYKFVIPDREIIETLSDKRKLYQRAKQIDIPIPNTYLPRTTGEVIDLSKRIQYPCILKPAFGYLFGRVRTKGILAENENQLMEAWQKLCPLGDEIVLQEYVLGDDDLQYSLASYFNEKSEPLAVFTARKIRQHPPETGVGTLVESCIEPEIIELGIPFLKKMGFMGIAEVEFKKDEADGFFKMIEVNTRIWTQNSLAIRCGVDIPYIAYCDACGIENKEKVQQKETNTKWLNVGSDLLASFGPSGYMRKNKLTIRGWIKSLRGKKGIRFF